jgi:hypothetical protein
MFFSSIRYFHFKPTTINNLSSKLQSLQVVKNLSTNNTNIDKTIQHEKIKRLMIYFCTPLIVGKILYELVIRVQDNQFQVDSKTGLVKVPSNFSEDGKIIQDRANKAHSAIEQLLIQNKSKKE